MIRRGDQGIRDFILELQRQAAKCNFTDLEIQLRDRLVAGINNTDIQKKLFIQPSLTYTKAKNICESFISVQEAVTPTASVLLHNTQKKSKFIPKGKSYGAPQHSRSNNAANKPFSKDSTKNFGKCNSCGGSHDRRTCKFRNATCYNCSKTGHISSVCRSRSKRVGVVEVDSNDDADTYHTPVLTTLSRANNWCNHLTKEYTIFSTKGEKFIRLIQDTGSPVSFLPIGTVRHIEPEGMLQDCSITISGVTGHKLQVLGQIDFLIRRDKADDPRKITFVVTESGPAVIGLKDLRKMGSDLALITNTSGGKAANVSQEIPKKIAQCAKAQGGMRIAPVKITVDGSPVFLKRRPLPFGIQQAVKAKLDQLVEQDILKRVEASKWATPIVTPIKADGTPRICGDYKVTVNPLLKQHATTTSEAEDLLTRLKGQRVFSKVDLQNAFLQIPIDSESQEITTITTQFGLYSHRFLPFGLSISPSIFQNVIDRLIQGLSGVMAYQDDLLVFAEDDKEHDERLSALLDRLIQYNVQINARKSVFHTKSISYLGFLVDHSGIRPDPDRFSPLLKMPTPSNKKELQSLIGCVQYYSRFIRDFAEIAAPLFDLLSSQDYHWSSRCNEAFNRLKKCISESPTLTAYSVKSHSTLTVDASETGIGGVLEQEGRPVIFVSRRMSRAERGYSQTQREALAIVWSVKRLHKYLFGNQFTIVTDHKSLKYIFDEHASLAKGTSNMLQRWAILLSAYDYKIIHKPGKQIPQADFLSRFASASPPEENTALFIQPLPISREKLCLETKKHLSDVVNAVKRGWTNRVKNKFRDFFQKRDELSLNIDSVLQWKELTVIPPSLRQQILQFLHSSHIGTDKMKSLARLMVWWPTINEDIRSFCKECVQCQKHKPVTKPTLSSWPVTYKPFQRVHIDYCGPFLNEYYALVLIDSYSKWPEVFLTKSASSDFTISALRKCFSREGIPQAIVCDNGTHFTASNVRDWLKSINCCQVFSPPRHPQSNGLAENFVRSLKMAVRTQAPSTFTELDRCIDNFLLHYRNAEHTTTHERPALLFKGRSLRISLFTSSSVAFFRGNNSRYSRGIIIQQCGRNVYTILDLTDGTSHRRHKDQIRLFSEFENEDEMNGDSGEGTDLGVSNEGPNLDTDRQVSVETQDGRTNGVPGEGPIHHTQRPVSGERQCRRSNGVPGEGPGLETGRHASGERHETRAPGGVWNNCRGLGRRQRRTPKYLEDYELK